MFKENKDHLQVSLYGLDWHLSRGVKDMLDKSWAPVFKEHIFMKINELRFACLYSDTASRPNFPVNVWASLEIMKELFNLSDEQLLEQFHFNYLTAHAVGLEGLGELSVCRRTLNYIRSRLLEYEEKTGRNLLKEEFNALSCDAAELFGVNTKIQRMDSTLVGSFIKKMSRLELLVKVLQNLYRDLPAEEQDRWRPRLGEYVEKDADHITFRLKQEEVGEHLKKVGELLFALHEAYKDDDRVNGRKSYRHVSRVLVEQYDIKADGETTEIEVKPGKDISSGSLQNPADEDATYRKKGKKESQGPVLNVSETCSDDSPFQLLMDVDLEPNNVSDETMLAERIAEIQERTGVEEMITDAAFSGKLSEKACEDAGVTLIPTEIKGRKESDEQTPLRRFEFDDENEVFACPAGAIPNYYRYNSETGRHVARFSLETCRGCSLLPMCRIQKMKQFYSLRYDDRQAVLAKRRQQLSEADYRQKCRMRPAVEGTISQFKRSLSNGKLKVRGLCKGRHRLILKAMGINFKRIAAYVGRSMSKTLDSAVPDAVLPVFDAVSRLISSVFSMFRKQVNFLRHEGADLSPVA